MIINSQATQQRRSERFLSRYRWGTWFAWFPVPVGRGAWAWLSHVERKRAKVKFHYRGYFGVEYDDYREEWVYRLVGDSNDPYAEQSRSGTFT